MCSDESDFFIFFSMRLLMTGSDSKRNFDSSESAY